MAGPPRPEHHKHVVRLRGRERVVLLDCAELLDRDAGVLVGEHGGHLRPLAREVRPDAGV